MRNRISALLFGDICGVWAKLGFLQGSLRGLEEDEGAGGEPWDCEWVAAEIGAMSLCWRFDRSHGLSSGVFQLHRVLVMEFALVFFLKFSFVSFVTCSLLFILLRF